MAHDRVAIEEVGTLDRAAAVALASPPSGASIGDLIRVTGRWDGIRLHLDQVAAIESTHVRVAPSTTPPTGEPFSQQGSAALHALAGAGILSGRRVVDDGRRTVLARVSDLARARELIATHQPPEPFAVLHSRWSSTQLRAARGLALTVPERELFSAGEFYDDNAEVHVTLTVKLIREDLSAALLDLPGDLVTVTAFLQPT